MNENSTDQAITDGGNVTRCYTRGISRNDGKPSAVSVFGDALYVVVMVSRDIFPHYPSAYVWFIYIHGYPDNETFNPGDPAVRTMNPITSCRL